MNQEYKCPYCGQGCYANRSKNAGEFTSWSSVSKHASSCAKNNKSYLIDKVYGPISIDTIISLPRTKLRELYPKLKLKYKSIPRDTNNYVIKWSKETILEAIKKFYIENNKIPCSRDFNKTKYKYPNVKTVRKYFDTWNAAIEAAGFIPSIQNGFGIDTYGLDGHLYRSQCEAYFADKYLYKKYEYVVEPEYPEPYNKYYDWYIPILDLYIELDGGIRPQIIDTKIAINKSLNRKLLVIAYKDVYFDNKIETIINTYVPIV